MNYETPAALRMAIDQRILTRANETGMTHDRLRRRIVFERIVSRLENAEPGKWVLKGGMALEVRLIDDARLTKDLDLGLRGDELDAAALRDRLIEALMPDPYGDQFELTVGSVEQLKDGGSISSTWRVKVDAVLAGKPFGRIQVDISQRTIELLRTERVPLPNSLEFAQVAAPHIEIIDIHRHAAEKFHAMFKDYGDRENSRVRDLVDLVILTEHRLIDPDALRGEVQTVWMEREGSSPPVRFLDLPNSWKRSYENQAAELELDAKSFQDALEIASALWIRMFPTDKDGRDG